MPIREAALTLACAILVWASACTAPPRHPGAEPHPGLRPLFQAATAIQDRWDEISFRGRTEYRLRTVDGRVAIAARGRHSASALIRPVETDLARCPILTWSWRVEELQRGADLRLRERDDVAASLFLLFGDPGFPGAPQRVPTLRYVWTSAVTATGAVIDSPYLPGTVRSLVIRSGVDGLGRWVTERRDVTADYRLAFGTAPPTDIQAIALFTDNDQTREPVRAYYERADLHCAGE